jgi:hypothetical protein
MTDFSDDVFGNLVTPLDVEHAVTNTLKKWMPTYLRFFERRAGLPFEAYPEIASWRSADTMEDRFPEDQIPAVQVMMTMDADLITEGVSASGVFNGTIDALVAGPEPEEARENAEVYAFCMGLIMAQQSGLDGSLPIGGLAWKKVSTPAVGKPEERWLALGSVAVDVTVEGVFEALAGPTVPTDGPPEEYPTVTETGVDVEEEQP